MTGVWNRLRHHLMPPKPPHIQLHVRSRMSYALGEASWTSVDQLTAGTNTAALMLFLGFQDGFIGMVISVGALACIVQMLTLPLHSRFRSHRTVVTVTAAVRFLMPLLFLIPLLPADPGLKMAVFIVIYVGAKLLIAMGGPVASEWIAQLTPMSIRGRYFGAKDATCVVVQATALLLTGLILDKYKETAPVVAFQWVALFVFIFCICGLVGFLFTKDIPNRSYGEKKRLSIVHEVKDCLDSRPFRLILISDLLWQVSFYVAAPFNSSYSIKEMGLSFTFLTVAGFASSIGRIFCSRFMGRWADRTSMTKALSTALLFYAGTYVFWILMRPSTAVPVYLVLLVFATIAWSFIGAGMFGIKLALMPEDKRPRQLAVTSAISGTTGFIVSFLSGQLLNYLQTLSMSIGGMVIYPQQILNGLGVCATMVLVVYLRRVMGKEEESYLKRQADEGTFR